MEEPNLDGPDQWQLAVSELLLLHFVWIPVAIGAALIFAGILLFLLCCSSSNLVLAVSPALKRDLSGIDSGSGPSKIQSSTFIGQVAIALHQFTILFLGIAEYTLKNVNTMILFFY